MTKINRDDYSERDYDLIYVVMWFAVALLNLLAWLVVLLWGIAP